MDGLTETETETVLVNCHCSIGCTAQRWTTETEAIELGLARLGLARNDRTRTAIVIGDTK